MQELKKLSNLKIDEVVVDSDPHYSFNKIKDKLLLVIEFAGLANKHPGWWEELPQQMKNDIEGDARAFTNTFQSIAKRRADTAWLASNYAGQENELLSRYNRLYDPLIRGLRDYIGSQQSVDSQNITSQSVEELNKAIAEARKEARIAQDIAAQVSERSTELGTERLSQYFKEQVSGQPYDKVSQQSEVSIKKKFGWRWWFIREFRNTKANYRSIAEGRIGYKQRSKLWLWTVIVTIIIASAVSYWVFTDFNNLEELTLEGVLARALVLAAPFYAIRFAVKNYNANKHLEVLNGHRAVVMDTLLSFFSRKDLDANSTQALMVEAARLAFATNETGYLSKSDSTGANAPSPVDIAGYR